MRLDDTSDTRHTLTDDEIWPRLEDAWRRQLGAGSHASPELYRAALSEVLRSYVSEKREGATLAIRSFGERNDYDSVRDRLLLAAQGVPVPAPRAAGERRLGSAEQRMVDQAKAEGRARARMGFLVALLLALVLLLGYVLDRTPAKLTWNEIPQTVTATVSWRDSWPQGESAVGWLEGSWRMEQAQRREEFDDRAWFVSLRTQACQDALNGYGANDDAAAGALAATVARQLQVVPLSPARVQHINHSYNQYIAQVHYTVAPVEALHSTLRTDAASAPTAATASADSTAAVAAALPVQAWLETAQLVVPDGLSALNVLMAHYTVAQQAPSPEEMTSRITRTISGRTLLCKAPTIWGWWFDRDRYLE